MEEAEIRTKWYEFANRAFIDWRGDTRNTISQFSEWVGISQSLMSQQMALNGKLPRDQKTISAWVSRYGNKIYEVLDLPIPGDSLVLLPEPLRSIALEIRDTLAAKQIPEDSPEAGLVMDEILKKHGYSLISIKDFPLE